MQKFILLFVVTLTISCASDADSSVADTTEEVNHTVDTTGVTEFAVAAPTATIEEVTTVAKKNVPAPTPRSEKAKAVVDSQRTKSALFELGCCKELPTANAVPCCCPMVVEQYKKMRAEKDESYIAELKKGDPIFADCRKVEIYRQQIEAIDAPPAEEEADDLDAF